MKKIHVNAPVILSYVGLCLLALVLGYLTKEYTTYHFFSVYRSSFLNPLTYLRFFTYALGHADFQHFFGNMLIILLVGPMLEEKYGSKKMLLILLGSAFVVSLVHVVLFPHILIGASGVAFSLITLSSSTFNGKGIPLTLIVVCIFFLGGQIIDGLFLKDNISQLSHIVGGVIGILFGYLFKTQN